MKPTTRLNADYRSGRGQPRDECEVL